MLKLAIMAPWKYLDVPYSAHTFLNFLNYLRSSFFSLLELVNEVVYKASVSIKQLPFTLPRENYIQNAENSHNNTIVLGMKHFKWYEVPRHLQRLELYMTSVFGQKQIFESTFC